MSDKQNKGGGARKIGRNKNSRYTSEHRFERNKARRAKTHARRIERKRNKQRAHVNKLLATLSSERIAYLAAVWRVALSTKTDAQVFMEHYVRAA